jgi:hypothetical protein
MDTEAAVSAVCLAVRSAEDSQRAWARSRFEGQGSPTWGGWWVAGAAMSKSVAGFGAAVHRRGAVTHVPRAASGDSPSGATDPANC